MQSASIAASATLAIGLDFGMDNTHVAGESIVTRKRLLFAAQWASDFLLAVVVDGVLMAR
jgi:hypothetical protein